MSFILDALKKSEAERLSKDTPGFSAVPGNAPKKSASHWRWIVAPLIAINIIVLVVMVIRPESGDEDAVSHRTVVGLASGFPAAASSSDVVEDAGRVETPVVAAMKTVPITPATIDTTRQSAAPAVAGHESPQVTESYATFNDLRAQGLLQLPDLHLDIHVYSSEPQDRFVFVNMSKYKEHATLDEGPVVREITSDGVILEYRGTKFLLPRE